MSDSRRRLHDPSMNLHMRLRMHLHDMRLTESLAPAQAVALGFIAPTGTHVEGRAVYATAAMADELQATGEDWREISERLALGAWAAVAAYAGARKAAGDAADGSRLNRWRTTYRAGDRQLPVIVAMHGVSMLVMLDGE